MKKEEKCYEEVKRYEIEVEGITPVMQHRFNGQEEEKKIQKMSEEDQAEKHAYRIGENIAFPAEWFSQAFKNAYVKLAGRNQKTEAREFIGGRIRVSPFLIDSGKKDYAIDKRSVPSQMGKKSCRSFCIRPRLDEWQAKFIVETSLPLDELKRIAEEAGTEVGVGSNRINGYGRFRVKSIRVTQ